MQVQTGGKTFREAWIAGVKKHYPGEPKPSYISPWADMPEWEQQSAAAVYDQVRVPGHVKVSICGHEKSPGIGT